MEIQNIQWFDNVDAVIATKELICNFTHNRVHVDWINCLHIRMLIHHMANCLEHMTHRLSKVFAAMCSNHNQTATLCPFQLRVRVALTHSGFQRINCRITGNIDAIRIFAFLQQILFRKFSGGKVKLADDGNSLTVEFFRVRAINIVSTQTSLNVTNRNLQIEAGQRSHKSRRSVAVNQNDIRFFFFQNFLDAIQNIGSYIEQSLLVLHNRQIVVRRDIKGFKNHIKHLAVLSCHTYHGLQFFPLLQLIDKRAHFDCFRSGTENEHYFFHNI